MEQTDVNDLTTLSAINLDVIVQHISKRYKEDKIYTYIGDILVAVNPFKSLPIYSEVEKERCRTIKDPPHIYWIAEQAVTRMQNENKKQCIVVSGDSGAGKTESTKHILTYLISRNECYSKSLVDKLNMVNPLIELFGNASTALNMNSSRFGKLVEIVYEPEGQISGGKIRTFVLEKSRVVEHNKDERNFHVFHSFFAGSSTEELESLHLVDDPNAYSIMKEQDTSMDTYRGTSIDETEYYSKMYAKTLSIMTDVGFQKEAIKQIKEILAACLLLGNVEFYDGQETGELSLSRRNKGYVKNAMKVLGVCKEKIKCEFIPALISKEIKTKDETVLRYLNSTQANDSRDALIKQLYACLFRGIIDFTNGAINGDATEKTASDVSISILDISGFEDLQQNGFEQLFINITNEKIQQFYIEQIFKKEIQDYRDEDLDFKEFHYTNNEIVLELLLKAGGILSILDDQMLFDQSTDESLVLAFNKKFSSNDRYHQKPCMEFGISHYAGKVMYSCSGFLVKNRGTRNDRLCSIIIESTNNRIIKSHLYADDNVASTKIRAQNKQNQMSAKDRPRKRKIIETCASQYQTSLRSLINRLAQGQPFFVRCIKPNDKQQSESFVKDVVLRQLKGAGILDVVKIRQEGYPKRLPFDKFKIRYKRLLPENPGSFQQIVAETLNKHGITDFRIGRRKIFLKDEAVEQLDAREKSMQEKERQIKRESKRKNSKKEQPSRLPSIGKESPTNEVFTDPQDCQPNNKSTVDNVDISNDDDNTDYDDDVTTDYDDDVKTDYDDDERNTDKRTWDIFRITEREEANNENLERTALKILRLMMYILLFLCILTKGTGTILIPLMLASRLNNDKNEKEEKLWSSIAVTQLMFCYCVPVAMTFLTSVFKSLFGRVKCCRFLHMVPVIILECGQAVGAAVLVFKILPLCSTMTGVIIVLSTMVFPAILNVRKEMIKSSKRPFKWKIGCFLVAILAVILQMGNFVFIVPGHKYSFSYMHEVDWKYLILGLIFFSLGYVENFIHGKMFDVWRHSVQKCRSKINIILCPMKVTIFMSLAHILVPDFQYVVNHPKSTDEIFNGTSLMVIYIICTILIKYEAIFACQLKMQLLSFYIALLLVPWSCFGLIQWQCQHGTDIKPFLEGLIVCHNGKMYNWIGIFVSLWLSMVMMTWHELKPECHRMAKQERLFVLPIRNSFFSAITLLLKRKDDFFEKETREVNDNSERKKSNVTNISMETTLTCDRSYNTKVPFVYICGTMWHETETEMLQLLKSMFRLDFDRKLRKGMHDASKFKKDFEFEIHIIFDDAFCVEDENGRRKGQKVLNRYVKQFISLIGKAASIVHKSVHWDDSPDKTTTPYGGQLKWILPEKSTLVCHLKDKEKIRHRKRWSQIMYMYYLLGFKLAGDKHDDIAQNKKNRHPYSRPGESLLNGLKHEKAAEAHNTFILTLDGDVDFKPKAVELLLDKMKANKKTGAVCGRIHPIGSGPMVWYQQFEYAIGHWLQKATEHVFGCVLCCPGAFSLFRASALMDDNVMRMYATPPTEAKHYIQFEQGEDRWLCTLMLQQGWRIDYAASVDAWTYAPESFKDFFIQRRRWAPSTLANIIDLMSSWRTTTKTNDNLSTPFIFYQFLLLASSLLGMGTVCLMVAGSLNAVLKISIWYSFLIAITPVILYVFVCFKCNNDKQIFAAGVLTCLYTIVMVVVTVGMLLNMASEPLYSPNVIFIFEITLVFIMSGICHPKEIFCLGYGFLYYLTVPSTFIFLTVYYMCNIHVVSWGTREGPKKPEESEQVNTAPPIKESMIVSCFRSLGVNTLIQESIALNRKLMGRQSVTDISSIVSMETNKPAICVEPNSNKTVIKRPRIQSSTLVENSDYWQTSLLRNKKSIELSDSEGKFWKEILEKYLHPIVENKEKQKQIVEDLKSLRNNVALGFFLINFLFVLAIMQLQVNQGQLKQFYILREYEPMSVAFLFVFAAIIAIQFTGMLFHRFETFLHLISSIQVTCKRNTKDDVLLNEVKVQQEVQNVYTEKKSKQCS